MIVFYLFIALFGILLLVKISKYVQGQLEDSELTDEQIDKIFNEIQLKEKIKDARRNQDTERITKRW